jgi:hypothetical protein
MATDGKLTIVEVSTDGTTFESVCTFSNEATVDFGSSSVNKEYCLSSELPFISLGDKEFADQTHTMVWSEGLGDAAKKIIEEAHLAKPIEEKTIWIRVTANNSKGTNGTQYVAKFIVSGYKHLFKKGEINKTEFTVAQTTTPVETLAA